jgi:hypothetical protein
VADETARSPLRSWIGNVVTAVLLLGILVAAVLGLTHMSVRAINPAQKAPKGHFPTMQCSLCHTVSASARLVRE